MKNKEKLYSIALASTSLILLLILVSSTALAANVENASLTINETRITSSGSATGPSIYGDRIVWVDWRNGNRDIYMYDLSTSKETQITTNKSDQTDPVIYGDKIVWLDMRNGENTDEFYWGGQDVYMYDLSTKKETRITGSTFEINPDFPTALDIYDNRIMWGKGSDFTIYDIFTQKETYTETTISTYYPAFYGNRVVWITEMNAGEGGNMYIYDLSTKKKTEIVTSNAAGRPAIYGDRIVWTDGRNGNWEIYMYDLSIKKETQITTNGSASDPDIYGDKIIWLDGRNGNWEIYMYDLSTHTETHTTNTSVTGEFDLYDDRIVWTDYRNGEKPDIYMGTLSESEPTPIPPVANFSATPTSGKTPLKVKFTSTSTGTPTAWKWSFGDGSALVTEQNPEHTYSKAGVYTVKHTAINAYGRDTEIKTKYVTVTSPLKAPVAAFSASPRSGKVPLKVQFADKSTNNPTSRKWSFGDETFSTAKNPAHTYSKAGKYTVKLTVKNAKGSSTKTVSGYIVSKK